MRAFAIFLVILLAGCAQPHPGAHYGYRGQQFPSAANILPDGQFETQAVFWSEAHSGLARRTAFRKLQLAAIEQGYAHYVLRELAVTNPQYWRFTAAGRLYRDGAEPAEAMPITNIGSGVLAVQPQGSPEAVEVQPPATQERWRQPPPPTGDEPIVIHAPDYLDG